MVKGNIVHPQLSYKITGLFFETHNKLGRYKNEKQYADFLEKLLRENNIFYRREVALQNSFQGEGNNRNIPDFIIEDKIIVDLKTKRVITKEDYFQMKRYLTSSEMRLGIIVNFLQKYITSKRILNPQYSKKYS